MPTPTEGHSTDTDALVLDRAAHGYWVPGPNANWQLIGDPIGSGKGFSRDAIRAHIREAHHNAGGGIPDNVHQFAGTLNNPFVFKRNGQYSGEIRRMLDEGGKEGTGMKRSGAVKLTDDSAEAGGEDAINAFRDRFGQKGEDHYWAMARDRAGYGWQDALEHAHNSQDPELRFAAAIHDHLPAAADMKNVGAIDASKLRTGQQFTFAGHPFKVAEDADGYKVLSGLGEEIPLEAIKQVPVDRGSLKASRSPRASRVPDDVAPFSNAEEDARWLHCPGVELSNAGKPIDAPKEILGQPVMDLWADAMICGTYHHTAIDPKTQKPVPVSFTLSRADLDKSVDSFRRMRANGVRVPIVQDHQEKAASSLGEIVDAKRDGDRLMLRHRFVGEDGIKMAARNQVSVKIRPRWTDARGNQYINAVTHSALTPIPAIPNQQGFSIAASRGPAANPAEASSAPVFTLAAPSQERSTLMPVPAELLNRFKNLPGAPEAKDDASAEEILSLSLSYAEAAGNHLAEIAEEKAVLLSRAEQAEGRALELSQADTADRPTAGELYFARQAVTAAREQLMDGGWTKASLDTIELSLCRKPVEPEALILSRAVEADDHLVSSGLTASLAVFKALRSAKAAPPKGETSLRQTIELSRVIPGETEASTTTADANPLLETAKAMSGKK